MRRRSLLLVLACACGGGDAGDDAPDAGLPTGPVDLFAAVDPMIGTGGLGFGVGSTYPGPALPFAMIHPGPDTRSVQGAPGFNHCSGYYYEDGYIQAFSLTRMNGTGVPDYGVIGVMPVDGVTEDHRTDTRRMAAFSHDDEIASPGYYRVVLADGTEVEITSTLRTAAFRFRWADGTVPAVMFDLGHAIGGGESGGGAIELDEQTGAFAGWMHNRGDLSKRIGGFPVYVAGQVSPAPTAVGVWDDSSWRHEDATAEGVDVGGFFEFAPGAEVELRVAISFVDADGAAANLAAEMPGFDFDGARAAAEDAWRGELAAVKLESAHARDAALVATSLYRALLMPTLMSDVDGRYRDATGAIATATATGEEPHYSDFSLWDTYRTLHPWLLLMEHDRNEHFARSLLRFADAGGALPRWALAHGDVRSMIGSPADMVMAESAAKGVAFDEQRAFDHAFAMAYAPATGPTGGRGAIEDYVTYGYVPHDDHGGSVSRTLEYAIADWALAEWARRLGRDADADALDARADAAWRALYDPDAGFPRPKLKSGAWAQWDDPLHEHDAYTEGNAWQYLWLVPNDLDGLAEAMGGRDAALDRLRLFFAESEQEEPSFGLRLWYWHGNEPDIHVPWIFAAWGEPAESVRWIDWVVREHYGVGPDGLPGNDDGGTMSAWILFAAAGIYPIAGTDRYIVAAPRQSVMVIERPSGALRIEAEPDPRTHPVPVRVLLDGVELTGPELTHDQLVGNHTLRFEMAAAP